MFATYKLNVLYIFSINNAAIGLERTHNSSMLIKYRTWYYLSLVFKEDIVCVYIDNKVGNILNYYFKRFKKRVVN